MSADSRTDPTPATGAVPSDRGSRGARLGVILLFGVIVAWFTWDAIGNLVALPELLTDLGLADQVPWAILVIAVALPLVYFAAGIAIGTRLSLARLALVLITTVSAIAVARLTIIAVATGTLSMLG